MNIGVSLKAVTSLLKKLTSNQQCLFYSKYKSCLAMLRMLAAEELVECYYLLNIK